MMNQQEVFDRVSEHLLTQKKRASDANGCCFYRLWLDEGTTLLKCGIGCLIKDDHYNPKLEGNGVGDVYVKTALILSGVSCDNMGFLLHLQDIHDTYLPEEWYEELLFFARRYELDSDKLENFRRLVT